MTNFTLCADDFGLNSVVDQAVFRLVADGRLNAVSCMAGGANFALDAPVLLGVVKAAPLPVEIGLHVTLTEYAPLDNMPHFAPAGRLPSIASLLVKSHVGALQGDEIKQEVHRQWQRFVEVTGRVPDFIDGHQHAHLMPVIRKHIIDLAKGSLPAGGWVRSCYSGRKPRRTTQLATWRSKIITMLAKNMAAELKKAGVNSNAHFYGINDFNRREDFGALMRGWLHQTASHAHDWSLIMCHPGLEPEGQAVYDPIAARRLDEYLYLSSPDFKTDMAKAGLSFSRRAAQD